MPRTKSIQKHREDGTFRRDRHAKRAEIEVGGAAPLRAPSTLQPSMRRLWRAVVRTLEPTWLGSADQWLLVGLVEAIHFQSVSAAALHAEGLVIENPVNGDRHKNAHWATWRQSAETVRALSVKLGLSPGDRARLIALAGDPADHVDAGAVFEQLMRNHAAARVGDDDSQEAEEWE